MNHVLIRVLLIVMSAGAIAETAGAGEPAPARLLRSETHLVIRGPEEAELIREWSLWITDRAGVDYGQMFLSTGPYQEMVRMGYVQYDGDGNPVGNSHPDDIEKLNLSSSMEVYSDSRQYRLSHQPVDFPYRLDLSMSVRFSTLFQLPDWFPERRIPVDSAVFRLTLPDAVPVAIGVVGDVPPADTVREERERILTWRMAALPAREPEDYMPPEYRYTVGVRVRAERFVLGDRQGTLADWESFGAWYESVLAGRRTLGPAPLPDALATLPPDAGRRERVAAVYRFIQRNTRYVHLPLGDAGWVPYPTHDVLGNRYGDCKDLSNLMVELLAGMGVTAYPALILTRGSGLTDPSFPDNVFDHCIVAVPGETDTMWVECTSDVLAAGSTPYSIEGANTLLITPDGGKLVSTPVSPPEANAWHSRIEARLTTEGHAWLTGRIVLSGNQAAYSRGRLGVADGDSRSDYVTRLVGGHAASLELETVTVANGDTALEAPLRFDYNARALYYGTASAGMLFVNPNILNRRGPDAYPTEAVAERRFPLFFNYRYADSDTVVMALPIGATVSDLPPAVDLETAVGTYRTTYAVEGSRLVYTRSFTLTERFIPLEHYAVARDFLKTVCRNDQQVVVLNLRR